MKLKTLISRNFYLELILSMEIFLIGFDFTKLFDKGKKYQFRSHKRRKKKQEDMELHFINFFDKKFTKKIWEIWF